MARLIGTSVFDPLGDAVGKVHDVVVLLQMRGEPRAVGFVIDVSSRRRVFLPLSRITAIEPGAVITTGLMNIRRFTQRHVETLVVGELLDRVVTMRDGSGNVTVRDVAIERDRGMDWKVTRLFVQRASSGPLGLRRGETFTVRPDEVSGLAASADQQGATALLATLEDLKPADLADVMRDLPQDSQMRVAAELTDERLADVLEELGNEDAVALLSRLEAGRAAHVLDATTALDELLEHRQLSAFPGDSRCTGAVHLTNLGYADLVLALGRDEDPAGADLIEHLRPHDALLLPGLDAPLLETLTTLTHDAAASLSRIHPATTSAWGGPDEHGVWTLDLSATLPFHPERLRSLVVELAGQGLCARGCFWLPSRPGRVCTWEVAGGAVSVGDAGTWAEVPAAPSDADDDTASEPRCHLVVTGVGDEGMREQVRRAFSRILLRPEEMAQALAWIGADDGLGDWFGQEGQEG